MFSPSQPPDEAERLASLQATGLLDTPAEERFDRITRLACLALGTKIALVSLVDSHRQWFKSSCGLSENETSREISFCAHAILAPGPFVVADARADPRFANNPLVTGPLEIRLYAGQPIQSPDGHRIGTLCVLDSAPRALDDEALEALADLAALVENELKIDVLSEAERRLQVQLSEVQRKASIDGLTRLWNREAILNLLHLEAENAARKARPVAVALLDIDDFKNINDSFGHDVGDRVLAEVARRIRSAMRPNDFVGRYGGEEFLAIIGGATTQVAASVGERIRIAVGRRPIAFAGGSIDVTVSIGVASAAPEFVGDTGALVRAADQAMYVAKREGKDRVRFLQCDD